MSILLFSFCQFGNPIVSHLKFFGEKNIVVGEQKNGGGFCPKATWSQLGEG
jgi:hypothetical protein